MDPSKPCPCKSGNAYADCCRPFHVGSLPATALQLMRSRFSAYALCLPEYILHTTHPDNPQGKSDVNQIVAFSKNTEFNNLTILDFQKNGDTATVTFRAHLVQQGRDVSFTEKSRFEKRNGKWLYQGGEMIKDALP